MGKKILYAAYGSNINLEQMAYRCPNSTVAGAAMLKGYELQFRYHATICLLYTSTSPRDMRRSRMPSSA